MEDETRRCTVYTLTENSKYIFGIVLVLEFVMAETVISFSFLCSFVRIFFTNSRCNCLRKCASIKRNKGICNGFSGSNSNSVASTSTLSSSEGAVT